MAMGRTKQSTSKVRHEIVQSSRMQEMQRLKQFQRGVRLCYLLAGGPYYDVPKGRKDGRRSKIEDAINLPVPTLNSSELMKMFGRHGFSAQETVAFSGNNAEQPLDSTRNIFDNDYYNQLQRKAGALFCDQTLFVSPRTKPIVNGYALNQALFFLDFQQAMLKMTMLDVKEASGGEGRIVAKQTDEQ